LKKIGSKAYYLIEQVYKNALKYVKIARPGKTPKPQN